MNPWWLLLLFIARIVSAQSDDAVLLLQANTAYLNRDYNTARLLYEIVMQSGARDPGVYFNLGNIYYESGDLGRSLLNYRRAQQWWPRDADLSNNLALVRRERVDLQGEETGFTEGLAALTTGILSLSELSMLVAVSWVSWFALLAASILKSVWRYKLRSSVIVIGIILLLGLFLLGSRLDISLRHPAAVVVEPIVQVFTGPGEGYLELYQLHAAAEIYVWNTQNSWVQFALPDGRLGWMPLSAVELVQP